MWSSYPEKSLWFSRPMCTDIHWVSSVVKDIYLLENLQWALNYALLWCISSVWSYCSLHLILVSNHEMFRAVHSNPLCYCELMQACKDHSVFKWPHPAHCPNLLPFHCWFVCCAWTVFQEVVWRVKSGRARCPLRVADDGQTFRIWQVVKVSVKLQWETTRENSARFLGQRSVSCVKDLGLNGADSFLIVSCISFLVTVPCFVTSCRWFWTAVMPAAVRLVMGICSSCWPWRSDSWLSFLLLL